VRAILFQVDTPDHQFIPRPNEPGDFFCEISKPKSDFVDTHFTRKMEECLLNQLSPGQGRPPGDSLWGKEDNLQPFDRQAQADQDKGDQKQRVADCPQIWDRTRNEMHNIEDDADNSNPNRNPECDHFWQIKLHLLPPRYVICGILLPALWPEASPGRIAYAYYTTQPTKKQGLLDRFPVKPDRSQTGLNLCWIYAYNAYLEKMKCQKKERFFRTPTGVSFRT
jgi:hypothetical protein